MTISLTMSGLLEVKKVLQSVQFRKSFDLFKVEKTLSGIEILLEPKLKLTFSLPEIDLLIEHSLTIRIQLL